MRKLLMMLLVAMSFGSLCSAREVSSVSGEDGIRADAERGFVEIIALWHDKNYDGLYDRTISRGSMTRKAFAGRLATAPFKPACCWQQVQDIRVTVKNDNTVTVRAKIGIEGGGDTRYRVMSFKVRNVGGVWRISRTDILSLAGARKKKQV